MKRFSKIITGAVRRKLLPRTTGKQILA